MSYKILSRVRDLVDRGQYTKGLRLLLTHNSNQPDPVRCNGMLTEYGGVPALTDCKRWLCWLHGPDRVWRESRRALLGALWLQSQGLPLYWIRLSAVGRPGDPVDPDRLKRLRQSWSKAAKAAGSTLHYYQLSVPMPSDGSWHAHMLASWLPDPKGAPTPSHKFRLRDRDFSRWVDQVEFKAHVEVAGSVAAVVGYLVRNMRQAVRSGDVPRVRASQSWLHERSVGSDPKVAGFLDRLHGDVYSVIDGGDPVRVPKSLVVDTVKKGGNVGVYGTDRSSTYLLVMKSVKRRRQRPGDGDQPDPVQLPLPVWRWWWWWSDFRQCSKCHQVLPITAFHRNGRGRRRPDCKRCASHYNRRQRPTTRPPAVDRSGPALL